MIDNSLTQKIISLKFRNKVLTNFFYGWVIPFLHILSFFVSALISFLIPKKQNSVIFFCNEIGLFGGNIKPLFIHALEQKNGYNPIIISFSKKTVKNLKLSGYEGFSYPSFKGIWSFLRAEKVVIECGLRIELCGLVMNSSVYQLWHGANLKYMVKELNTYENLSNLTLFEKWVRLIKTNMPKYEFIVSPSEFYKKNTFSKSFSSKKVVVAGYPRNDLFFRNQRDYDLQGVDLKLIEDAKKHRENGGKVVLYCPTWRDKALQSESVNPFPESFVSFLEENNILFIIKKHHRDNRKVIKKSHPLVQVYDHSKDIYVLMKYSDILITDYSSIFFDYLLLNKPVLFFPYDYEIYVTRDRKFQYDYDEFTPGRKCKTYNELEFEMKKVLSDSSSYYLDDRNKMIDISFGKNPCKNSSKLIWNQIVQES